MAFFSRFVDIRRMIAEVIPALLVLSTQGQDVWLEEVPDYAWHAGCFGTASGNLMGYWDRHGLSNLYTGPTMNGVAPLNSNGSNGGIRSMWASKAGFDGRPTDQPGHVDDYWEGGNTSAFESTGSDPYLLENRLEHEPDCLGDFMGQSQNKWSDLGGECSGNINGYAFMFWDAEGNRRVNFQPPPEGVTAVRDIQSGIREWSKSRGYEANVFSQLVDINPTVPAGAGFTFQDLKAEIDAGYPVLLILQHSSELSRSLPGNTRANPSCHAMVAYGYLIEGGETFVRYRTSWASGDSWMNPWQGGNWEANLPLRGVLSYRPRPRIASMRRENGLLNLAWDGPSSVLMEDGAPRFAHRYVLERATELGGEFTPVTEAGAQRTASIPEEAGTRGFYRVRLLDAE